MQEALDKDPKLMNNEFVYLHDLHETFFYNEDRHWEKRSIHHMDDVQTVITHVMRQILISWLLEVCSEFKLPTIVYFMGVRYFDTFLAKKAIPRQDLQLVGITCLFLAWYI